MVTLYIPQLVQSVALWTGDPCARACEQRRNISWKEAPWGRQGLLVREIAKKKKMGRSHEASRGRYFSSKVASYECRQTSRADRAGMQADSQSPLTNAGMIMHCNYKHQHNYFYKRISTSSMTHIPKVVYTVEDKGGTRRQTHAHTPL